MASFIPSLLLLLSVLKQSAAASNISSYSPSLVDSHLSLKTTVFAATNLLNLFESANWADIVEEKRGTLEACEELHRISISNLKESLSEVADLSKVRGLLSSVLTNHWTCLEGLRSTSGPLKDVLESSFLRSYEHVNASLSVVYKALLLQKPRHYRRLMSSAEWLSRDDRSVLEAPTTSFHPGEVITVAADGSGMFRTISDAIRLAVPDNSDRRTIIHIKKGVYREVLNIPAHKTNIFLVGEGDGQTVITGQRNWVDGWQTFKTATVGVSARGFMARDITFENTAGPTKHQAVALRVNAEFAAFYRCGIHGFQDTLYAHSGKQFYRECNISGTIDFICGDASAVFQSCQVISKKPLPGQSTLVTAQSRKEPTQDSGFSLHRCSILASPDLASSPVKNYLGRPWQAYSRTVILESYISGHIDPAGWSPWKDKDFEDTLYYGEYENHGPGSSTARRVGWSGFHVLSYQDTLPFMVSPFIWADKWLATTSFPYDPSI
ncbi:probable pectinesterase/pectinesterase inhibitor 12 [Syzygium oleosum]|uniref:probable pectinesterase/pectinesterase inhibitor 12 n=1 Tax=Syzygium oleosum TaxID=219896 RepID=UPI0024B898BD|nr:probable pectinesterase/pectinesterase inhibitor 12 [Syzygium oleosum]